MCAKGVMLMFLSSQNRIDVDADVIALVDKKIDVESWPLRITRRKTNPGHIWPLLAAGTGWWQGVPEEK